jgi:hypothetical protein
MSGQRRTSPTGYRAAISANPERPPGVGCLAIRQVPVDEVTYYHIELPRHDLVLAEGMPAESYLDTGDRHKFDNGGAGPIVSHSDSSAREWETLGCARLVVTGPELNNVRRDVAERASTLQPSGITDIAA